MPFDFIVVFLSGVSVDQVDDAGIWIFTIDVVEPITSEGIVSVIHLKSESLGLAPEVEAIAHFPVAHFSASNLLVAQDGINKELEVWIVYTERAEPAVRIFFEKRER